MVNKVGFIGLGTMGRAMATNVLNAGFKLTVYDLRRDALQALADLGAKVVNLDYFQQMIKITNAQSGLQIIGELQGIERT